MCSVCMCRGARAVGAKDCLSVPLPPHTRSYQHVKLYFTTTIVSVGVWPTSSGSFCKNYFCPKAWLVCHFAPFRCPFNCQPSTCQLSNSQLVNLSTFKFQLAPVRRHFPLVTFRSLPVSPLSLFSIFFRFSLFHIFPRVFFFPSRSTFSR